MKSFGRRWRRPATATEASIRRPVARRQSGTRQTATRTEPQRGPLPSSLLRVCNGTVRGGGAKGRVDVVGRTRNGPGLGDEDVRVLVGKFPCVAHTAASQVDAVRSEEHTSELQSRFGI